MSQNFVITGAFGALGAALADAAKKGGARLALIDFVAPSHAPADGGDVVLGSVDLGNEAAAAQAISTAAERLGGVDALFNVAGGFRWELIEPEGSAIWSAMFQINLMTCLNASRAAIPHLKQSAHGRIVNVGANAALKAAAGMGAYTASKAGVHRLTESLAEELKPTGVTVNAVMPSIIDTPANRADMPSADFSTWVAPAQLAAVMLFLASEQAQAITGALVPVTGRV
jgi:NAD(P)-dependent dehydrogenase (short-subunit alcohol dehydrogenase family)